MVDLKPCPFCGCNVGISDGKYPNGDKRIELYGYHDGDCPIGCVLWRFFDEDGWTVEKVEEAWNRRAENG